MSRVFRTKRMRMTAWLLSAAVFMGSMDVNMLTVQAAQEEELYVEAESETAVDPKSSIDSEEADDPATGNELPENDRLETEEDLRTENGMENAESIEGAGSTDTPINEETSPAEPNEATAQEDAGADGDETPKSSVTVSISGLTVSNQIYNGEKVTANGELKAIVPKEISDSKKDEDVTALVVFKYSVTGTKKDGQKYFEEGSASGNITNGMPKDAGDYTLTVTVEDPSGNNRYVGSQSYQFTIKQRTITIKPKDMQRKIGDPKPELNQTDKGYDDNYIVTGMVGSDKLTTKPTINFDVTADDMKKTGQYTITASGADAGANYVISYQEGTLTVLSKEIVTISGITVSDKVYDGEPIVCDITKVIVTDSSGTPIAETDAPRKFTISGGKKDGTLYFSDDLNKGKRDNASEGDDTSEEGNTKDEAGTPTDAGTYTLKVTIISDKYWGEYRKEFSITQRPVTVKAGDIEIKQDAKIPEQSDFRYTTTGLLEGDELTKEPLFDCDIISTEKTGKYSITPKKASAGSNYVISYQSGTLTVLEKDRIEISGVTIPTKVYDGTPAVCNKDNLKVVLNQSGSQSTDITDQVTFSYSISGTTAAGRTYSSSNIENGMPKDAGEYTLTVTAASKPEENGNPETDGDENSATRANANKYQGSQEYTFKISQRPIVVKVNNLEIKTEDELPKPGDFSYDEESMGMGFVGEDTFTKEPTFTCDIQNTDKVGTYDIIASDADAGYNYSITYQNGKLTVVEKEVQKTRRLLRIIALAPVINVENGTTLDKMELPETVAIVTRDFDAEESPLTEINETAAVVWDRKPIDGTSYSPRNEGEQTFWLGGTVELPADVDGEEVSLDVKVRVSVREKWALRDTVAAPTASIPSGSAVRRGTTVRLSCETEGAQIYYTLDSKKPERISNLYTTPIEVNSFTVIWAYAYKEGQPDSSIVKFYYYIDDPTAEDDDESEVLPGDIPSNGIIPEGLWVAGVQESYNYTGQAIKPVVRVYDYKKLLTEKKDYTIKYANNVKAADMKASKAPSVTITGKGNYEGKITKKFTILQKNIEDSDVSIDDITLQYNKKVQTPVPVVLWNGKKLAAKKDYIVESVRYAEIGSYSVQVTGIGNYTGVRKFNFAITDEIPVSKLTVSKIPNQTYTGDKITPQLTVKYKGKILNPMSSEHPEDYDYDVEYVNNQAVGTATAIIKGHGSYAGTRKVTFNIVGVAVMSKAKVELGFGNEVTPTYTGKEIKAKTITVTINVKNAAGQTELRTLKEENYSVEYINNVKVGTATAIITGRGAYSGTIKKTFKIIACDMGGATIRLNKSYSYVKGGCKPEPVITFGGSKLKAGTDYTLAYKNNNAVGNAAVLTVKGKGNFKGSVTKDYIVEQQDIGKMTVTAADKVYQNKKNIYKTTIYVTDVSGKRLAAGTDYEKTVEYTYAADYKADGFVKKKGDPVEQADIIPAGTEISVKITAKGTNYTGTTSGTYRITQAGIAKAKVTIPTQTYTGKAITLTADQIRVELNGKVLKPDEYEIVEGSYSNNTNKGTAKVTIHGLGSYGGTKTVSFKIKGKGFSLFGL